MAKRAPSKAKAQKRKAKSAKADKDTLAKLRSKVRRAFREEDEDDAEALERLRIERDKPLTAKEDAFVKEYCVDGNATRACEAAGYSAVSRPALAVQGSQLLRKPNVAFAIRNAKADIAARNKVTVDEVVQELRDTLDDAKLVGNLNVRVTTTKALGQTIGMFGTKVELGGPGGGPIPINAQPYAPMTEEAANDIRWHILGTDPYPVLQAAQIQESAETDKQ